VLVRSTSVLNALLKCSTPIAYWGQQDGVHDGVQQC